jgi:hypothetical protein
MCAPCGKVAAGFYRRKQGKGQAPLPRWPLRSGYCRSGRRQGSYCLVIAPLVLPALFLLLTRQQKRESRHAHLWHEGTGQEEIAANGRILDVSTLTIWLWETAWQIRGSLDAPKLKNSILELIVFRRMCDGFCRTTPGERGPRA